MGVRCQGDGSGDNWGCQGDGSGDNYGVKRVTCQSNRSRTSAYRW